MGGVGNIWFCGYRDWALDIFEAISTVNEVPIRLLKTEEEFNAAVSFFSKEDLLLFVGWSWIISKDITDRMRCVCLHPSPLPKYRGGSPIQHQIINGEEESAVTLFLMNEDIDKGPILFSKNISLAGNLNSIFLRIIRYGKVGLNKVINQYINEVPLLGQEQQENEKSYYRRRTPEMSELTIDDFRYKSSEELYNKIRALADPYPNAYFVCADGKKLFIKESSL